jgi:ubiquinone/menaquinone biosynthesis C-methylase UbiE
MTLSPGVARVAALFDAAAESYDSVGVPWFGPIAQDLADALAPEPGERVLDIGCGRGAVLQRVADAVGPAGRAVGVDVAPGMARRTARLLADRPQVDVLLGDATALGLGDATFDVVAASLVLFFLPAPGEALTGWARLVRPGGRLGITTFGEEDPRWRAVDEVFDPYLPQQVLDARTSGRSGPFASDAGVEQLLRDAGLREVRTVVRRHEAVFTDAAQWELWSRSHGQRQLWAAVPADEVDDVRGRAFALLAHCRRDDGRLSVWQDVRTTLGRRPG